MAPWKAKKSWKCSDESDCVCQWVTPVWGQLTFCCTLSTPATTNVRRSLKCVCGLLHCILCVNACVVVTVSVCAQNNSLGPEGPSDTRGAPLSTPNKHTHTQLWRLGWHHSALHTLWVIHRIFYFPPSHFFLFPKAKAIRCILQWPWNSCGVTQISWAEKSHITSNTLPVQFMYMCITLHIGPLQFSAAPIQC